MSFSSPLYASTNMPFTNCERSKEDQSPHASDGDDQLPQEGHEFCARSTEGAVFFVCKSPCFATGSASPFHKGAKFAAMSGDEP
jgi:hypothetical protein